MPRRFVPTAPAPPTAQSAQLALRRRAEQHQHLLACDVNQYSPEEWQRLVQELQIHQIELEMQYEEVQLAQAEAEASHSRYLNLYDFAPISYLTLDAQGAIEQLNLCAAQLLGAPRQQLVGRRLLLFVAPESRAAAQQFLVQALASEGPRSGELALLRPGGLHRYVELQATTRPNALGEPRCQLVVFDIDERRRTALALATSEARFRATFEQSRDGMALLQAHHVADLNASALHLLGNPAKSLVLGQPLASFWPLHQPDGRPTADQLAEALAQAQRTGWSRLEWLRPVPDGQPRWDELSLKPVIVQGQELTHLVWRDITEHRRLAEEATQQRLHQQQAVLSAILSTQETERKRIAEALHNGVGQLLYATRLSLENQQRGGTVPPASLELLDEAIRTTRTISFELTPGVLEDFGLRIALEELVKRIAPSHLPVRLHFAGLGQRLPPPAEIATYRIIQELINNVLKHAHAHEVVVHVTHEAGRLEVSVEDDGCGFVPAAQAAQPLAGIGLTGIRNRVALFGGHLTIASEPGRGTIVSIELLV